MKRPNNLSEFVGQKKLKQILAAEIQAARTNNKPLRHMLLGGMAGTGKTSLASVVSNELGYVFKPYTASKDWTPARITKELLELDTTGYTDKGVRTKSAKIYCLFFDECHRMPTSSWESWYSALEDCQVYHAGGISWLPYFTWIGATTSVNLPKPLRDRIGMQFRLEPYTVDDLVTIIRANYPKLDMSIYKAIATRSRSTPRIALQYTESYMNYGGMEVFDLMGIDAEGLGNLDRAYLGALKTAGRPLSLSTLASMLREDSDTLAETVEPVLLEKGLVYLSSKGRELAEKKSTVRGARG